MCARAWRLEGEFDVAEHLQLANPDTNHIFPEYLARCVDGSAGYLADRMKEMMLISFSMPTDLNSPRIQGSVQVIGIFHGKFGLHGHGSGLVFQNIRSHRQMGRFEFWP
jgi:hypothetical protein